MRQLRQIGSDMLSAVLVLALVFLSFAHTPLAGTPSADQLASLALTSVAAADVPCGNGRADDTATHAPCHACRLGAAADLPPSPQLPISCQVPVPVAYLTPDLHPAASAPRLGFGARAPPTLV